MAAAVVVMVVVPVVIVMMDLQKKYKRIIIRTAYTLFCAISTGQDSVLHQPASPEIQFPPDFSL